MQANHATVLFSCLLLVAEAGAAEVEVPPRPTVVAFAPDGKTIATGRRDGSIQLSLQATVKEVRMWKAHQSEVRAVAFSPDGQLLVSAGRKPDKLVCVWDTATGTLVHRLEGHKWGANGVVFAPDGKSLASWDIRTVRQWDVASGKEVQTFTQNRNSITGFAFGPEGAPIATMNEWDGTIRVWDVTTNKEIRCCPGHEQGEEGWRTPFAPDGKTFAAFSADQSIRIFDVATGERIRILARKRCGGERMVYSPDGKTLAAEDGNEIRLWEVATGEEVRTLKGHGDQVLSLAFSPDGKSLGSASQDATVRIWDLYGGQSRQDSMTADELEKLWLDMAGSDAAAAHRAMDALASDPQVSVSFLGARLPKRAALDPMHLEALIAGLESDRFTVRQKASAELESLIDKVEVERALGKVLESKPSLDLRSRAEQLLRRKVVLTPEQLRWMRTVQVLEMVASAEAKEMLNSLAREGPTWHTRHEAETALARLVRCWP